MERTIADETLVQARKGESDALAAISAAVAGMTCHMAQRLLGESTAGRDIVSDVWGAVEERIGEIESADHLRALVLRITRNLCYSELRRRGRYNKRHGNLADDYQPVEPEPGPAESTEQEWLLQRLSQAVDALPEPQRQALILYAHEGMPYDQVALALGCPPGTARSRIHHARKTLRRRLGPEMLETLGVADERESDSNASG